MDPLSICKPFDFNNTIIPCISSGIKNNIRYNLSQVIQESVKLDQAMNLILNNREVVTTYKLTKPKR